MLRRHCIKCGSAFLLQDSQVHTKCPSCRPATVKKPKPSRNGKAKGKPTSKRKR